MALWFVSLEVKNILKHSYINIHPIKCLKTSKLKIYIFWRNRVTIKSVCYQSWELQQRIVCTICWCNRDTNIMKATNQHFIIFKAHSMRLNSCLTLLKRPITWECIGHGPRGKPTIIVLIKEHSKTWCLQVKNYAQRSVRYSAPIRENHSWSRWLLTQMSTPGQSAEIETQSLMCYLYQNLPWKTQGSMWKRRWKIFQARGDEWLLRTNLFLAQKIDNL